MSGYPRYREHNEGSICQQGARRIVNGFSHNFTSEIVQVKLDSKLGLPGIGWHSLRYAYATLLDAAGAPLGTVQALLGHSSPEITRETYFRTNQCCGAFAAKPKRKPLSISISGETSRHFPS